MLVKLQDKLITLGMSGTKSLAHIMVLLFFKLETKSMTVIILYSLGTFSNYWFSISIKAHNSA